MRVGARLALIVGAGVGVVACQPLYGGKPEKLVAPVKKKAPPSVETVEAPIKEIDECQADFRRRP